MRQGANHPTGAALFDRHPPRYSIAVSSKQQFTGVGQISGAISSIGQAVKQNLDGVKQLEGAAKRQEELGTSLKELVQRYKVRD